MQQDLSDFKFQYGLVLSNSRVYIFTNSKNQILTISEKVGKFINGDTLMARITPCLENGKVAYINFLDKEETAFGSTEYIVFHAKEGYPNEMFYFLTRNKAFIEFATKNMNGSSGRQRVSGETIGNYIIPVLSEDDINELKTVSESTMKEILKNNLESRVLSEMRNTILPKLMSGELKINDLTC